MANLTIPIPNNYQRLDSRPIDTTSTFTTYSGLTSYLSNGTRYAGQIVTCDEKEGSIFILNSGRTDWIEYVNNKIVFDNTPWNTGTTDFTLDYLKRYDFSGTQCMTSVNWTFSTPSTNIDYEYWFKLGIGNANALTQTFSGCIFALHNDDLEIGGVYEFSIKSNVVYIRKNS